MKRNEGCEKDYGIERRGEEKGEMRLARKKDERCLSKFRGASSGRGAHYIFLSISGRDRFLSIRELRVQQRKVLANMHTHTEVQEYYLAT
ncbi:hypothetical protein X777_12198 [Ooceraea biroi]|uniref:Uncharacterized protein n=1 Tax=Ooceraea biroi TaxID=2015173 RepID=A0A026W0W5_OOCBI|nr:hypothetical protein X777_12198 [Ooceraea biroi]